MAPSASRALIACLACALLALRPVPLVEGVLDWTLAPLRIVAEMALPVSWTQTRARAGSGRAVVEAWEGDLERHDALEVAVKASALPSSTLDERGLWAVHGEVVGRERGATDRLRVRVQDPSLLAPGQPVVHGDWYVGRVLTVPGASRSTGLAPDEIVVELVTASTSRICARVQPSSPGAESPCRLVVGGLAPRRDEDWLDVHNPTRRAVREGTIEVFEPPALTEGPTLLANGFLLGDLVSLAEPGEGGFAVRKGLAVRPGLDYESGLYQVLVLAPALGMRVEENEDAPSILRDGHWRRARPVLRGSPSPWREGHSLALGTASGVRPGAAIAAGARLFGRVDRAGPFLSSVRTLGDRGFAVAALAFAPGEEQAPHVLGRITSLGRDGEGHVLFHWPATVPLLGDQPLVAELWTGSGEPGLPRGLLLGTAELPPGPGPHRLRLRQPEGTREPYELSVRLPDNALLQGLEGGGS